MIPTYMPTGLLDETLQSVRAAVARAAGTFQIEIVDDASPSSDLSRFALLEGLTVGLHRRTSNGGLGVCWNDCIARAQGRLIHILHQDDLVLPDFYVEMERLAAACPDAGMLFCRAVSRRGDERTTGEAEQQQSGVLDGWLEKISAGQRLLCPSAVVRRETYFRAGGYDAALKFVIDWEMWVRIASCCPVAYTPQPLVEYRVHDASQTFLLKSRGCIADDLALGYDAIARSLCRAGRPSLRKQALAYVLWCAWDAAASAERIGNRGAARQEAFAALRHWLPRMRPKQVWRLMALLVRNLFTLRPESMEDESVGRAARRS